MSNKQATKPDTVYSGTQYPNARPRFCPKGCTERTVRPLLAPASGTSSSITPTVSPIVSMLELAAANRGKLPQNTADTVVQQRAELPATPARSSRRRSSLGGAEANTGLASYPQRANTIMLLAKEMLEASGNLKREIKMSVIESLGELYQMILQLSESSQTLTIRCETIQKEFAGEIARREREHSERLASASLPEGMSDSLKEMGALMDRVQDVAQELKKTEGIKDQLASLTAELKRAHERAVWQTQQPCEQPLPTTLHTELEDMRRLLAELAARPVTHTALPSSSSPILGPQRTQRAARTYAEAASLASPPCGGGVDRSE
ncbi:hypothetical protein JYU34_000849 [Plutella xylostella]|uniref:Uncharacterized protein n=1 Tax=Plutella xylostella TaxID=51655 RepID=A0ABQ7R5J2_PLUXY|nr:hypothetical protein JYU34_000849 [Plutella xylostella]